MTRHHLLAAAAGVALLLGLGAWRLLPTRPPPAVPCENAVAVRHGGRIHAVCLGAARERAAASEVVAAAGAGACPAGGSDEPVRPGSMVVVTEDPCAPTVEALPGGIALTLGSRVDLNRADPEDLEALPRIGPALAGRIVRYRDRYGPYLRVEDLERVKGIGPKTVERLRDLVVVRRGAR